MNFQLIYCSRFVASEQGAMSMVRNILEVSEVNNGRDGITGFLIFDKTNFLQVLEGDASAVERTYARICRDKRHDSVVVINRRDVDARAFEDWAMGGYVRTPETQHIYARHGIEGTVEPQKLDANQVIALALDLLTFESDRRALRGLSARA